MRVRLWMRGEIVALAAILGSAGIAPSAEGAQPGSDGESVQRKRPIGMDELTVTARKREGRLQEIPLAASAVGGAELKELDLRQLRDLDGLAPNLAVVETAGAHRVYVRGIGTGDSIASDGPGVGLYLDGVYLTRAQAGLFTLADIERVEVLRGPQGTLFGKNSIGGAVNLIASKPALDDLASRAEVRVGNHERLDTRLSLNVPLIPERAAARVSFAMARRDGFQKGASTGRDLDDDEVLGLRTQLRAAPSDDLELVLSLDGSRERRGPRGYGCKVESRSVAMQVSSLGEACTRDGQSGRRRISPQLTGAEEQLQTYGASLTTRWTLQDALTLTSISAWRSHEVDAARDGLARSSSPVLELLTAPGEEQKQLSQELQLAGGALADRLSYVTGLFWLAENAADARLEVANRSYAAYGQGTYELIDRLSLTLGARLGAERKRVERGAVDGAKRSRHFSPLASLKYELSDGIHVYGTGSRGFKSGGFDAVADPGALGDPLDGEELTAYEIGFKSLFLDNRVQLNAALFYSVYEGIPLGLARADAAASTGRARIKGAELELRAVPHPGFELSSAFGMTHSRYTGIDTAANVAEAPGERGFASTPTYTMSFGASYQLPLGSLGDLRLRADWTHIGRSASAVPTSRSVRTGKHGELDAQLAWMLGDGLTEIVLFARNLLDRAYVVDGIDLAASSGSVLLRYNAPRAYGLEIRRSF